MAFLCSVIFTFLIASATVLASPLRPTYAVKDTHHVPSRWLRVHRAPGDHMINLQIGLKQSQFDELERHLYEGIWLVCASSSPLLSPRVDQFSHSKYTLPFNSPFQRSR